jgi:hypothetical protein
MTRLGPLFAGVAVVVGALFLLGGARGSSDGGPPVGALGLLVAASLAALALTFLRRRQTAVLAERGWSAPVAPQAPSGGRTVVPSGRAVAMALGRVEGRQFTNSAWFAAGIAFCLLMILLFGFVWAGENGGTRQEFVELLPWFAHPMIGMVVLAAYRATTRAARDGADELFDSCPADPGTRTAGFLLSAAVPVATLGVFLAVLAIAVAFRAPSLHGPLGADSVAQVLGVLVLGAGGVALGVALGRWVRFGLAPVIAVVLIGFVATAVINGSVPHDWKPLGQLSTAPPVNSLSPVFADKPAFWHLLWLIGLTALVGVVALARHRRDRTVAMAAAATVVVLLAAGVGPTAAAFPAGMPRLTLRQVFINGDLGDLPPEVRRRLTGTDLGRPAGEVALGFGYTDTELVEGPAFSLALASLGLPYEPDEELPPTVIAGQARGVVAMWLATRDPDAAALAAIASVDRWSADPVDRRLHDSHECSVPPVVWSAQDRAAARTVLALPATQVAPVVSDGWSRWSDPRTGTDELLAALGLPAVGPFDSVVAQLDEPC